MPIIAVVDPDMMSSMPKGLTASTGMDALTHAIEGYTTKAAWEMTDMFHCHASNYSSHLRQLYRRLNPTSPLYHLSQRAVFYGTFLSALLTIPILSHIVFS